MLSKFEQAAKNAPGLFEKSKNAIINSYNAILKGKYSMEDISNLAREYAFLDAVVNFIANQELLSSSAKVVELISSGSGYRLKVRYNNVERDVFLIYSGQFFHVVSEGKKVIYFKK